MRGIAIQCPGIPREISNLLTLPQTLGRLFSRAEASTWPQEVSGIIHRRLVHSPVYPPNRWFECSTSSFEASSSPQIPNLADRTVTSFTAQLRPRPRVMHVREQDPHIALVPAASALLEPVSADFRARMAHQKLVRLPQLW